MPNSKKVAHIQPFKEDFKILANPTKTHLNSAMALLRCNIILAINHSLADAESIEIFSALKPYA